jgi:hypothetical protein
VNKAIGNHSTHKLSPRIFGFALGTAKPYNSLNLFDNCSGQTQPNDNALGKQTKFGLRHRLL